MNKFFHIIILFFNINILFNGLDAKNVVISLGNACGVAGALRDYHLRQEAYPFDWIVSPFDAVCEMITTDFATFLDKEALEISNPTTVFDQVNGFKFIHDFPTHHGMNNTEHDPASTGPIRQDFLNYLPSIKEKYNRRISRFINALHGNDRIYLIRNRDVSIEQALMLCLLLEEKFPNLDFLLIVVDDENKITSKIDQVNKRIKFFYGSKYIQYESNRAIVDWKKIFKKLNLI